MEYFHHSKSEHGLSPRQTLDLCQYVKAKSLGTCDVNVPLSKLTTLRVGGLADVLITPFGVTELSSIIKYLYKNKLQYTVLGNSSNVLISDAGIRGVTIKLKKLIGCTFDDATVFVEAGYALTKLAVEAAKRGLSGLEFASGIPATIGGAIYMNAGGYGSEMSHVVTEVNLLMGNGEAYTLSNDEMKFGPRNSILHSNPAIVTSCRLKLRRDQIERIFSKIIQFKRHRHETQPYRYPSVGSIFMNPPNCFVGYLIEEAGLKGYTIGGAQVSQIHANQFINIGGATAQDFVDLIAYVRSRIHDLYSVNLRLEVKVIGEHGENN